MALLKFVSEQVSPVGFLRLNPTQSSGRCPEKSLLLHHVGPQPDLKLGRWGFRRKNSLSAEASAQFNSPWGYPGEAHTGTGLGGIVYRLSSRGSCGP